MNYLKPAFKPGEKVISTIAFRKDGNLYDPFSFEDVEIYDDNGNLINTCIWPHQITSTGTGLYQIEYDSSANSKTGAYKVVWNVRWEAYDEATVEVIKYFFLENPEYDTSLGENYALAFKFNLLNSNIFINEKRFLRVNVEETYKRTWNGEAQMKIIRYHNKWNIEAVLDWSDCSWENQEMICMFDTTSVKAGKYFVQIKLNTSNGETVLSPQMKIDIIDGYST